MTFDTNFNSHTAGLRRKTADKPLFILYSVEAVSTYFADRIILRLDNLSQRLDCLKNSSWVILGITNPWYRNRCQPKNARSTNQHCSEQCPERSTSSTVNESSEESNSKQSFKESSSFDMQLVFPAVTMQQPNHRHDAETSSLVLRPPMSIPMRTICQHFKTAMPLAL